MQYAIETPRAAKLHHSMAYIISGDMLQTLVTDDFDNEQLKISFAKFCGTKFSGMPRPDVNYYPALAMFRLPAGHRIRTFDHYQMEAGTTALIYPMYRNRKARIRKALIDRVIPVLRNWHEGVSRSRTDEMFYAFYDQTFDELVFGPGPCARASRRQMQRTTRSDYSIISFASQVHVPSFAELG
jgi:hypothetical protein